MNAPRKYYYVSAYEAGRYAMASGPYLTHDAALSAVDSVKERCCKLDARAVWAAWGTSGSDDLLSTFLGAP